LKFIVRCFQTFAHNDHRTINVVLETAKCDFVEFSHVKLNQLLVGFQEIVMMGFRFLIELICVNFKSCDVLLTLEYVVTLFMNTSLNVLEMRIHFVRVLSHECHEFVLVFIDVRSHLLDHF
jgi:hypothetical protein